MMRPWIVIGILGLSLAGCSQNVATNQTGDWYYINKQWISLLLQNDPSRIMNLAILKGTVRGVHMEGLSQGYLQLAEPTILESFYPCELPKEMFVAFSEEQFKERQPRPGDTLMIAAAQTNSGTKDGYWSLINAVPIPAAK